MSPEDENEQSPNELDLSLVRKLSDAQRFIFEDNSIIDQSMKREYLKTQESRQSRVSPSITKENPYAPPGSHSPAKNNN